MISCGKNEDAQPDVSAPVVNTIAVADISDNGDGSDLEISFAKVSDESFLSEYRVFVVKQIVVSSFDLVRTDNILEGNYIKLEPDGSDKKITLNTDSRDSDGRLISESVEYVVFVLSVADGINATSNSLSQPTPVFTLEQSKVSEAKEVKLLDIANAGNANDIEVLFSLTSIDNIEEIRVFIVKEDQSVNFDLSLAESIESGRYSITNLEDTRTRLSGEDQDTNGDQIVEGVSYVTFIMTLAGVTSGLTNGLSSISSPLTLDQVSAVSTLTSDISGGSGGMDVDANGNIYMADFGATLSSAPGTKVFKITPEGEVSIFADGLVGASGNDFDANGNLIQANIGSGTVSQITPDGSVTTITTGFSQPVGVTVDENGDFFVCNCASNSISKVSDNGNTVSTFVSSALMNCPNGIDMDNEGNLYVASFSSNNLVKINPNGEASVLTTLPSTNNGHLLINGNFIYVISRGLHQIHRVPLDGSTVDLFAGSGTRGIMNGGLLEAGFSFPNDLAFSPDGKKMYINDVNAGNDTNTLSPVVIRVIDIVE